MINLQFLTLGEENGHEIWTLTVFLYQIFPPQKQNCYLVSVIRFEKSPVFTKFQQTETLA